ncbi:Ig-like domain-containing protein, partial [uncultured Alcanivorax sp.]|uniref:Ig-like domain-containing protein n=1 Tax=uncultured Alcanivorax sp. TaxID=191215 RepID=UPI0030D71BE4
MARLDGSSNSLQESFQIESNAPTLLLSGVGISGEAGNQRLDVSFTVGDDTDVAYLSIDAAGLRASVLRASGGVVKNAREQAFAETPGGIRVYPDEEGQNDFVLSLPVNSSLEQAAVLSDALVLVEAHVVDSSGNQTSLSEISFVGDDVNEEILGFQVAPASIVFSNPLEEAQLVPSLEFQFRGLTPVPGRGKGVSYQSSDPGAVYVSDSGTIYPLKETPDGPVAITVTYSGQESVVVPVTVDYSKVLEKLKVEGLSEGLPFVLASLNHAYDMPSLLGVFDDGSSSPLTSSHKLSISVPEGADGLLDIDQGTVTASTEIPESSPVNIDISLLQYPGVGVQMPIVAEDALPSVNLQVEGDRQVDSILTAVAVAKDDVSIRSVDILLDGAVAGSRKSPPYEVSVPVVESMAGRSFEFVALVEDSSGQVVSSGPVVVSVTDKKEEKLPSYKLESPIDGQRVVENTPLTLKLSSELGEIPPEKYSSGISYVEYFFDGQKVAEAASPVFDVRESPLNPDKKILFEVWKADVTSPEISTRESSISLSARLHGRNGAVEDAPAKLLKIMENAAPTGRILAPVSGATATVGQSLEVVAEFSDDTLALGTFVELLVDGEAVGSVRYTDEKEIGDNNLKFAVSEHAFNLQVMEEWLGDSIGLSLRVVDHHGKRMQTEPVRIPVKGDEPPGVAVSHPVDGQHLTSGLPVELRANAVDDLAVSKVDFYVNGKLVGTDLRAPYAIVYETPERVSDEQPITIRAEATDSANQKAISVDVVATLGKDEEPPVINLASPEINGTDSGDDVARVVEKSDVVVKLTGYDNVGVDRLELYGIRYQEGQGFVLTGNQNDLLTGDALEVQQIPGVMRAFSALKLVQVPAFSNFEDVAFDSYPIRAVAYDEIGNSSEVTVVIRAFPDKAPEIIRVQPNKQQYLPRDTIKFDVLARDDRAVTELEYQLYDTAGNILLSEQYSEGDGLVPAADLLHRGQFDLSALALPNVDAAYGLQVKARDQHGLEADVHNLDISVFADKAAPVAVIVSPGQGVPLYHGNEIKIDYRVTDQSPIKGIEITVDGQRVHEQVFAVGEEAPLTSSFRYSLPEAGDEIQFVLKAIDQYDNEASSLWRFALESDAPPKVSIRTPSPGARLVEGEQFVLNALVSDDRGLSSVAFVATSGGKEVFERAFSGNELSAAEDGGAYLSAPIRVPHKIEGEENRVKVVATDSANQVVTQWLDIEILDDDESPAIALSKPDSALSLYPGKSFEVVGAANDNFYVNDPVLVLENEIGEQLDIAWSYLGREERVEEVVVANQESFGSAIEARRFELDFSGRVKIPKSFIQYAGNSYDFYLIAEDNGVNRAETLRIPVTLSEDSQPPVIEIKSPNVTVYEQQEVALEFSISDDIFLESYKAYIKTDELAAQVVAEEAGLDSDEFSGSFALSLPEPVGDEPATFTVTVEAIDTSGNKKVETRLVTVNPDLPPHFAVDAVLPKGGLVHDQMANPVVSARDDVPGKSSYFPLFTSLSNLDERQVQGGNERTAGLNHPHITLGYPEAGGWDGALLVNGKPYIRVEEGRLRIDPSDWGSSGGILSWQGIGVSPVRYRVRAYSDNVCIGAGGEKMIELQGDEPFNVLEYLPDGVTTVLVTPEFAENGPSFIDAIRIDVDRAESGATVNFEGGSESVQEHEIRISLLITDQHQAAPAFIESRSTVDFVKQLNREVFALPVPMIGGLERFSIVTHGVDRLSHQRPPADLYVLANVPVAIDSESPEVVISSPEAGTLVVPGQQIFITLRHDDNTGTVKSVRLYENRNRLVNEIGGRYDDPEISIPYLVPHDFESGELELTAIVEDASGYQYEQSVLLPLDANEPPLLSLEGFHSYEDSKGGYRKNYSDPARLNYGEFWVRSGEGFQLDLGALDDAGLQELSIYRIASDQVTKIKEYSKSWPAPCPEVVETHDQVEPRIHFAQAEPTEYLIELEDTYGHKVSRSILVHPQTNMAPEVRFTAPSDGQQIVAGTFSIKVGVVATDDRIIDSNQDISVFANGVELSRLSSSFGDNTAGGEVAIEQAFDNIHASLTENYGPDMANSFGHRDSPFSIEGGFQLAVPGNVIRGEESLALTAYVSDSDGSVGVHEIEINLVADTILPEPIITRPDVGFGAVESADFDIGFRGYDNVKVNRLDLLAGYGLLKNDGTYLTTDYETVRSVTEIPSRDFEPVTTVNIDSPEYVQRVNVERLAKILSRFDGVALADVERFDYRFRVTAYDASGHQSADLSVPVTVDERPVIDVVSPEDGEAVVEGTRMPVNVQAFDDVGVSYVRLVAEYGNGQPAYEMRLRKPPYSFSVPVPEYVSQSDNQIFLSLEALDTYGAAFDDLDNHTANESLSVRVIEDQAPSITIGQPSDGDTVIEGQYMLVQVNAIDDVLVDRVALNSAGLKTGDRSVADMAAPYEFLVSVPYGQAGRDLALTASVTERRYAGEPRTISTVDVVNVHVEAD